MRKKSESVVFRRRRIALDGAPRRELIEELAEPGGLPAAERPVLLAVSDLGVGASLCFERLRTHSPLGAQALAAFRVLYVDFSLLDPQQPSLRDASVALLDLVRKVASVGRFYGLGVGFGANVLAYYALSQPRSTIGLTFVSGPVMPHPQTWMGELYRTVTCQAPWIWLKRHLFGEDFREPAADPELLQAAFGAWKDDANPAAYRALRRLCLRWNRDDAGPDLAELPCRVLAFVGSLCSDRDALETDLASLKPGKADVVDVVGCARLVTAELPDEFAEPWQFWLMGDGFLFYT